MAQIWVPLSDTRVVQRDVGEPVPKNVEPAEARHASTAEIAVTVKDDNIGLRGLIGIAKFCSARHLFLRLLRSFGRFRGRYWQFATKKGNFAFDSDRIGPLYLAYS